TLKPGVSAILPPPARGNRETWRVVCLPRSILALSWPTCKGTANSPTARAEVILLLPTPDCPASTTVRAPSKALSCSRPCPVSAEQDKAGYPAFRYNSAYL